MKRQSTEMREQDWAALTALASSLGCSSWRVLVRRIAVGELDVLPKHSVRTEAAGVRRSVREEPHYVRDPDAQG